LSSKALRNPNCTAFACTWRSYVTHSRFSQSLSPFDIYEDESFKLRQREWPLYCRPDNFGYSVEEGEDVFPTRHYPTCLSKFPRYESALFFQDNWLVMNCSGRFQGKYVLGDSSFNGTILLPASFRTEAKLYTGPVKVQLEEWALGTCEESNENLYEQVAIRLQPNKATIFKQNLKHSIVSKEAERKFKAPPQAKTIVFLLTVDSASRRHFYRKLPKTVEFLKSLNGQKYHIADFLIHNVIGDNSARNQVPVLSGSARITPTSIKELEGTQEAFFHGDSIGPRSLLKYANDRGFVTMLSFEFCHQYFASYIGDRPDAHHVMANFWCGAKKYAGFNFEKSVLGQRCVGPHMSHHWMLEYIKQFTEAYKGLNQFIYTHLTTGHEASGTQIQTLDEDLTEFLQGYVTFAEKEGYEVAILLQGDHGMRYGEWYKNIAAFQEHRLPAFFSLCSRTLLDKFESAYDVIEHNRKRLVGKLDLYLTAKSLMLAAFLPSLYRNNTIYASWRTGDLANSMSLFLAKIPNTRSCSDVHIPSFYCACMRMEPINPSNLTEKKLHDLVSILEAVISLALEELNTTGLTSKVVPLGHICQKLTLKKINSMYAQRVSTKDEAFKVEFEVNEHPTARFETYAIVGVSQKHVGIKENQEGFLPEPGFFRNRKKKLRLIFLKRLDSYSGFCEEVAFAKAVNPALCICHPTTTLQSHQPALISRLLQEVQFRTGQAQNCSQVCETAGEKCDTAFFEVLTDPVFVGQKLGKECYSGNFTGTRGEECVVSGVKSTCGEESRLGHSMICPCR